MMRIGEDGEGGGLRKVASMRGGDGPGVKSRARVMLVLCRRILTGWRGDGWQLSDEEPARGAVVIQRKATALCDEQPVMQLCLHDVIGKVDGRWAARHFATRRVAHGWRMVCPARRWWG